MALYIHPETTEIAVYDRAAGETWFSNPQGRSMRHGVGQDVLQLRYDAPTSPDKLMDSWAHSVQLGQAEIIPLGDGVRVEYLSLIHIWAQLAWAAPYASYTFDFYGNPVPAPQAYTARGIIDGPSLGTLPLREPRDLAVSPAGEILIADTGNNRILRLNSDFELIQIIDGFWHGDTWDTFAAPVALYVTERERLYVCLLYTSRCV